MVLQASSHVITNLVRVLFSVLDRIVYGLLVVIYNLFTEIAKIDIFGNNDIGDLGRRIYTIIGVLILFKLAISVITYIIDPDKLSDSKKGFASIIKNVVIMFVLIITVPVIFKYAMILQQAILDDDTIGRLITGKYGATSQSVGPRMATSILAGFVRPNDDPSVIGNKCDTVVTYSESEDFTKCIDTLNTISGSKNFGTTYKEALKNSDYKKLIDLAATNDAYNGEYIISYSWLISTVVGGFTAYILLLFCLDIAVRTAKFAFLQLIAPIPIVTYMDDGGQGVFKKWVKACTSTYASLFVRLAGIYFAIYLIDTIILNKDLQVCTYDFSTNQQSCHAPGFFAVIFLILGTLMFAKQLPKLIEEITGVKLDGDFTLNPMKKLGGVPLLGAATGFAGAGLGSFAGNIAAGIHNKSGFWKTAGSAFAGLGSGAARGMVAGLSGKNKDNIFKNATVGMKGAMDARNLRAQRVVAGDVGLAGVVRRTGVALRNTAGIQSGSDKFEKEIAAYDEQLSKQSAIDKLIEGEVVKGKAPRQTTFEWTDVNGKKNKGTANVNVLKQEIERLKNAGASATDIQNAEYQYMAALKQIKKDYINEAYNKANYDASGNWSSTATARTGIDEHIAEQVKHMISDIDYTAKQNASYEGMAGISLESSPDIGSAWDSLKGQMHGAKDKVTSTEEYKKAMANKKLDKK